MNWHKGYMAVVATAHLMLCFALNAEAQCSANFTFINNCEGEAVKFTNTSTYSSSLASATWVFDSAGISTQSNPEFVFPGAGTYNVKLVIITTGLCTDSITKTITIYPAPNPETTDTIVCMGQSAQFSANLPSGVNYASLSWDFGDNSTSGQTNPFYNYSSPGTYYPSLLVTHNDNTTCRIATDRVKIMDLPKASFILQTKDTLCFNETICLKGNSTLGSSGAPINQRVFLWGDGSQTTTADTGACHVYTDNMGGSYKLTFEVTDTNGCISRYTAPNDIVIRPRIVVSFTAKTTKDCYGATVVALKNTTNLSQNKIKRFEWDFGNNIKDTVNYNNTTYTYNTSGNYVIRLSVWDSLGCMGVDSFNVNVSTFNFDLNAKVDTTLACRTRGFNFSQTPFQNGSIKWNLGNGTEDSRWNFKYSYSKPGEYIIKATIKTGTCDTTITVDTITVLGPVAKIGDITNQFQCEIHDTVTLVDNSDYRFSFGVTRIWDFADHKAPLCTTNTKTGSNINSNCNFSKDSSASHMYTPGEEMCYFPSLLLVDTITGCRDSAKVPLPLMPPNATGATFKGLPCLGPEPGKAIELVFEKTEPTCLREKHWVMWDSLCARQSGNFDSFWVEGSTKNNYTYDKRPCDPDGNVTIGLVILNGTDANGNPCYDTVWYHHVIQFSDLDPRFTTDYVEGTHYCPPATFKFSPIDKNLRNINGYTWTFGDGTTLTTNSADTVSHQYTRGGAYQVTLKVVNADGCEGTETKTIKVGYSAQVVADKQKACSGSVVNFSAKVNYLINNGHLDSNQYWQDPNRIAAGKETLQWDFGDGQGFTSTLPNPTHTYTNTGKYTIRLALKDSTNCRDTITLPEYIEVYDVKSDFTTADSKLFCFQLVQFLDKSTVNNKPAPGLAQPKDSIRKWFWTFGDKVRPSVLKNPVHDYTYNGDFQVTLRTENSIGCKDSITKTITIEGPRPRFSITSDSVGCAPLTVHLKNTSTGTRRFIWRFGDENNTTLSTTEDTSVSFTYTKPGTYFIYLFGDDTLTDPITGNRKYCAATYPDTNLHNKIKIVVRPTPVADFEANVKCSYDPVIFTNKSTTGGGTINSFYYNFGNNNTSTAPNPSNLYTQPGDYTVTFAVKNLNGCSDTIIKTIKIPKLKADFYAEDTILCIGQPADFFNTSTHDHPLKEYKWDFGNGTSSTQENPQTKYTKAGFYDVSLIVTDTLNCRDTILKTKYIDVIIQPFAPEIYRATVEDNSSININWGKYSRPDFKRYHLYREAGKGTGNYIKVHSTTVADDTSFTDIDLNTLNRSYCYKLQVEDVCGNLSDLDSFTKHCTVELTATAGTNRALLNWNHYTGWQNGVEHYDVLREIPQQAGQFVRIGRVPGTDSTYIDSAIICNQTLYYKIRAVELNGNLTQSYSDTSGATPEFVSTLPEPELVTATVVDDKYVRVDLELNYNRYPYEWQIEKSEDGINYNFLNTLASPAASYNDNQVNVDNRSYFYRATVQDSCGDKSGHSNYGKTILLKTRMPADRPLIEWSRYEEWPEGVESYSLQFFNTTQQQWVTKAVLDSATFDFADDPPKVRQDEYCYRVMAHRIGRPYVTSTSNVDCVPVELALYAPNAFTPGNRDSLNDGFRLKGAFVFEYKLQIFTRWGELIFETNDLFEEWDGTYKGRPAPEGVYIYVAHAAGSSGQSKRLSGTITLLR